MPILTSSIFKTSVFAHRYLGSVAFAFKNTMTTTLNHKTCIISSGQVLEKTPFAVNAIFTVKIEMVANRVFLKTLSRSIYTSFMVKGGSQCVLIAKNY